MGLRLRVRAFVVEMAEDEHQVADPAGDQIVLNALVLEEVEGGIDEGKGAQPRHGDLQVGVGGYGSFGTVPVTILKFSGVPARFTELTGIGAVLRGVVRQGLARFREGAGCPGFSGFQEVVARPHAGAGKSKEWEFARIRAAPMLDESPAATASSPIT